MIEKVYANTNKKEKVYWYLKYYCMALKTGCRGRLLRGKIKKGTVIFHACASNSLPQRPGQLCTGGQWLTCYHLMGTQSSKISSPSMLSSHWWVATIPGPCFKTPTAFVVHIWQTHTFSAAVPLSLEPSWMAVWRKMSHRLSSETMVTQSLGTRTKTLSSKPY